MTDRDNHADGDFTSSDSELDKQLMGKLLAPIKHAYGRKKKMPILR